MQAHSIEGVARYYGYSLRNVVLRSLCGHTSMKNRVRDELSRKTINDHRNVHIIDQELRAELGDIYHDVSRGSIYRRIAERTGYCEKRVAWILNHTTYENGV